MSEDNSEPPSGWAETTLGAVQLDLATGVNPARAPGAQFELYSVPSHATGAPEVILGADIGSNKQTVVAQTVLLCKINPRINRVWVTGNHSAHRKIASTEWIPFFPISGLEPRYLAYFLRQDAVRNFLAGNASGVGGSLMRIKAATLQSYKFQLAPWPEQERIADTLDELFSDLDAGVAALERAREKLKLYRASVLKAAVEGTLTAEWREQHPGAEPASELLKRILAERRRRWEEEQIAKFKAKAQKPPQNWKAKYKEPLPPDRTKLSPLPRCWCWASVEEIASGCPRSVQSGPFGSQLLHAAFGNDGYLAIGIDNVLDGTFSLGRQHRITAANFRRLCKFEARPRDVVVTVMSTVGRVCVLPSDLEPSIITKHCYRITVDDQVADPEYLGIALRAENPTRHHIYGNIRGQTRPGINGPILKIAPVPLPPPAEQQAIIEAVEDQLSAIDHLEADLDRKLKSAHSLRQSILLHAFTGQLVPQDPNDEPASELLKRIAAEREARARETRKAKRSGKLRKRTARKTTREYA